MRVALDELAVLQQDPELAQRCRTAAEEVFSLQSGTQAYQALYQKILDSSKSRHGQ